MYAIGLHHAKNSINIGAVLRACDCYGASLLAITGKRYKRVGTDVSYAYKKIPVLNVDNLQKTIPFNCVPIAIEITENAKLLFNYQHPENAFYIFGGEDQTLGKKVLSFCRDVIYVPTSCCMNLACCVNVVLYDRMSKNYKSSTIKINSNIIKKILVRC